MNITPSKCPACGSPATRFVPMATPEHPNGGTAACLEGHRWRAGLVVPAEEHVPEAAAGLKTLADRLPEGSPQRSAALGLVALARATITPGLTDTERSAGLAECQRHLMEILRMAPEVPGGELVLFGDDPTPQQLASAMLDQTKRGRVAAMVVGVRRPDGEFWADFTGDLGDVAVAARCLQARVDLAIQDETLDDAEADGPPEEAGP